MPIYAVTCMYITLIILVKLSEKSSWSKYAVKEQERRLKWNFYGGWIGAKFEVTTSHKGLLRLSHSFSQMSVEEGEVGVELRSPQISNISAEKLV